MQKALKVGVGEMSRQSLIGFPSLRCGINTAVGGSPYPLLPSQRLVTNDSATAGLSAHAKSSIFQQYPALRLLLDPVQWPPISHRAHIMSAVQQTVDTTHSKLLKSEFESTDLENATTNSSNILIPGIQQTVSDKEASEILSSSSNEVSSQLTVGTAVASSADKKRARRLRRQTVQATKITELNNKLRAQKLLLIKSDLRHSQQTALRAWAAECKRARAEIAHKTELDRLALETRAKLERSVQSKLERSVQLSKDQLHERRLWLLSPCGRKWRMQRIILQMWAAGCAGVRLTGTSRVCLKKQRSGNLRPASPPLPTIVEATDLLSHSDGLNDCTWNTPSSEGAEAGISWGCMHSQTYSKGLLLLHRGLAQKVAEGPPGLSLITAEPRDRCQFTAVSHRRNRNSRNAIG